MQYPNLFKRIIPFALALALGLFVAGFFVSLLPTFKTGKANHCRMKAGFRELKLENESLKAEVGELKQHELNCKEWDFKTFDLEKEEWREADIPSIPKHHLEKKLREKLERLEQNR
jgi:hypothetical protein